MTRVKWFVVLSTILNACTPSQSGDPFRPPESAAYFWRTTLKLSERELQALKTTHIQWLYVRFFDVDWCTSRQQPIPVAPLSGKRQDWPEGPSLIPVVFIRNEVFEKIQRVELGMWAEKLWLKTSHMADMLNQPVSEIQIDCDWTSGTKDSYFEFLERLKNLAHSKGVKVSATIRLHQVKFREKTGIPPVDAGMLMFYNMGVLSPAPGKRYVFDESVAVRYLHRLPDYPLKLDVVLPMYSQWILGRNNEVIGLLSGSSRKSLRQSPSLIWRTSTEGYWVQPQRLGEEMMNVGDQIKWDGVSQTDFERAHRLVRSALGDRRPSRVAFFDWAEENLESVSEQAVVRIVREW